MDKFLSRIISARELPLTFVRFYSVGLLLFMLPFTRNLFISIIWISLLLVIGVVFYHHRQWTKTHISVFLFIIISSFLLEMAGVATGKIFGSYLYERGLGPQLYGTPLIIGLNWLLLVYASHDITTKYLRNPVLRVVTGALLMILYDMLMEWVAPVMQMWQFAGRGYPPFDNFLAWFLAALFYHACFELFRIRTNNRPARALFVIQAGFFLLIGVYSYLVIS